MAKKSRKPQRRSVPSEAEILEFVRESKGAVGKREIARAFGLKGSDRIALKQVLRDLKEKGVLSSRGAALHGAGELPQLAPLDIVGVNADGELEAAPVEWDESLQGAPPKVIIAQARERGPPPAAGDRVLARISRSEESDYPYVARIVRKLLGADNEVIGVFQRTGNQQGRIVPVDKKSRKEFAVRPGDEHGASPGELVTAVVSADAGRSGPRARVRKRLGDLNDPRNISLIAIHEHGIPTVFPEAALAETRTLPAFSPKGRTDLRQMPLVTIDPADARDHDDAVWAEPDDDPANAGGHKVVVAIADVAAYVQPGTALDREARIRGNSVYFPDRVVPMLPERISNDLCSLREKEERPAIACFMVFDRTGNKKRHSFSRVVMRSAAKLTYEEAQAAIDGRTNAKTETLLGPVLKPLWNAYDTLSKARVKRGPLDLDLPERKIVLDEHGLIDRVVTPARLDSHRLIEEFMIQANVAAAETLEERQTPLIYRVHDTPAPEKVRNLSQFLTTLGLSLPPGQNLKPKSFNQILAAVRGREHEQLVNDVVLRSQAQAIYSIENRGHFGLNLRRYAHFTSPIRRYADLIVHRGLVAALGFGDGGLTSDDILRMADTAELISQTERRAMAAERATVDRLVAAHLAEHVGARFPARISGVVGAGLFVMLLDTGADGFVPASTLGHEYFAYHEAAHALVGQRSGETYRLGDRVEVEIREVAPVTGGIRCVIVSPGKPGKPLSRQQLHAARRSPQRKTKARERRRN